MHEYCGYWHGPSYFSISSHYFDTYYTKLLNTESLAKDIKLLIIVSIKFPIKKYLIYKQMNFPSVLFISILKEMVYKNYVMN